MSISGLFHFGWSGRLVIVLTSAGILIIAVSATALINPSAGRDVSNHTLVSKAVPGAASATQPVHPLTKIQTELITITPRGFLPHVIKRPSGQFLLVVDNRASSASMTLRLYQIIVPPSAPMIDIPMTRQQLDWSKPMTLQPGHYLLSVVGHPTWTCAITVY